MHSYSPFNNLTGKIILPCFAMALFLVASWAPGSLAHEEASGNPPQSTNPHASPPGPNTPLPSGIWDWLFISQPVELETPPN